MSKLTERLRQSNGWELFTIVYEAADRIEHLERVLVQARDWVAERPEDRKISAGKLVSTIDRALKENDSAIPTSRF